VTPQVSVKCSLSGEGLRSGYARTLSTFNLDITDDEEHLIDLPIDALKINIKSPAETKHSLQKIDTGKFKCEYFPNVEGDHYLDIFLHGHSICQGRKITIFPSISEKSSPDPAKCELVGLKKEFPCNRPFELTLVTKGSDGLPIKVGGIPIDVFALGGEDLTTEFPVKVTDKNNGEYVIKITPTEEGPMDIEIQIDGLFDPRSPYSAEIIPGKHMELFHVIHLNVK